MTIGAFITITDPEKRGDTYKQCREMAEECFDEVKIVDGRNSWPKEFDWEIIGKHFQAGYEELNTDWVYHLDTDFIFHERDYRAIRMACENNPDAPALSFWKHQFVLPDRYNLKSRLVIAVNKGKYGDRIRFDGGGESDLCQPSLDGKLIKPDDVPEAGIPFYNYEKIMKSKEQIMEDVGRMERAYLRHFGRTQYGTDGSDEMAYKKWVEAQRGKLNKPQKFIEITDHPLVMQETIKNLKPEQWGYDGHGNFKANRYASN